jgi:hypothetical protein
VRNAATSTKLILALTAIAVAVLQTIGGVRGYWCLCGDKPTVVAVDHCHGPHGMLCLGDKLEERHGDESSDGDTEQHAVAKSELKSPIPPTTSCGVTAPVLLALRAADRPLQDCAIAIRERLAEVRESPPLSVAVVRAVVFLI